MCIKLIGFLLLLDDWGFLLASSTLKPKKKKTWSIFGFIPMFVLSNQLATGFGSSSLFHSCYSSYRLDTSQAHTTGHKTSVSAALVLIVLILCLCVSVRVSTGHCLENNVVFPNHLFSKRLPNSRWRQLPTMVKSTVSHHPKTWIGQIVFQFN